MVHFLEARPSARDELNAKFRKEECNSENDFHQPIHVDIFFSFLIFLFMTEKKSLSLRHISGNLSETPGRYNKMNRCPSS